MELTNAIKAISPPADGGPTAYLAAREAGNRAMQANAQALKDAVGQPSRTAVAAQDRAGQAFNRSGAASKRAAVAYGLKVCEQPVR